MANDTFFMDTIMGDMSALVSDAMGMFREQTASNLHEQVFRKFKEDYANLDVETILKVRKALGHTPTENNPCKVCRYIANKEIDLMDEQAGDIDA